MPIVRNRTAVIPDVAQVSDVSVVTPPAPIDEKPHRPTVIAAVE
jgi:hypothetical protein